MMGYHPTAKVFYGFILPQEYCEIPLEVPEGIHIGVAGDNSSDPSEIFIYIAIAESISIANGCISPLTTKLFGSDGVIAQWREELEEFLQLNNLTVNSYQCRWNLAAYYG